LPLGRWYPFCRNPRQAAKVDRIQLNCTDIEELILELGSYLGDDLRFPTPQAPQMCKGKRSAISA
jgi:hypothetical protein